MMLPGSYLGCGILEMSYRWQATEQRGRGGEKYNMHSISSSSSADSSSGSLSSMSISENNTDEGASNSRNMTSGAANTGSYTDAQPPAGI